MSGTDDESAADAQRIHQLFDELFDLTPAQRAERLTALSGEPALVAALDDMFAVPDAFLERRLVGTTPYSSLSADTKVGAFRVLRLIGRGGMGEVYLAERCDPSFAQQVALKLLRPEAVGRAEHFHNERRILATLEHPGIARLVDGGIAADGRPYMAMEYVDGDDLLTHCRHHGLDVAQRLALFRQICEAVSYAHRHLVVHRDLKPSNIHVTPDGQIKLLDFGIARLLVDDDGATHTQALLTPDYAAPEQIEGRIPTTATDVYALGAVLYTLLSGRPPWRGGHSLPSLLQRAERALPPPPSVVAGASSESPISVAQIRGDLDAIVLKALRPEIERRYASASALWDDLERHLQLKPVHARGEHLSYRLRRFLRRRRGWVAAGAVLALTVVAGVSGIVWQSLRAQREADRAQATRDFLIGVFRASDPRVASDKPRGQITARELLDQSAGRITTQFANDPQTEIELLGTVADIYGELGETDRYHALHRQQIELARSRFGDLHPAVIGGLLDDAEECLTQLDDACAQRWLAQADRRLHQAGADQSELRARWWLLRSNLLMHDGQMQQPQEQALQQAIALYARVAPQAPGYVTALSNLGTVYAARLDYHHAASRFQQALAVKVPDLRRDDAERQTIYGNLARALQFEGDIRGAEQAYDEVVDYARRTYGEQARPYWIPAAFRARMMHLLGDRQQAMTQFAALMAQLPRTPSPADAIDAAQVGEWYGNCLAAEGRPLPAIPLLEAAERQYRQAADYDFALPRVRATLGDAYDRAGRTDDARRMLKLALDERVAKDPPDFQPVLAIRERWGRFLLDHGDTRGAKAQFDEVMAQAHDRPLSHIALAQGDLARVALISGDIDGAVHQAKAAIDRFDQAQGFIDVRMGPYLWRIYADALSTAGDASQAAQWRARALAASRRYDAPESPTTRE
ncbi:serine/threonine-protein kinase [Solimonas marina]|uniref:Protein kinase n=1 Tax=Solimonas marina TaxID=2714601 RepID=A0A970B5T0_9GAMM|nr:serine/threonine-protein kinase [Solimonas marina]NKF23722.1 protein kinase [Solimonas marina]